MFPIIAVTGTKGKTTVVRALDSVLAADFKYRLRVDTDGAWLNNRLKFSHNDSRRIWGLAPAAVPGRFITLLPKDSSRVIAILECNLFNDRTGLGYQSHKVGVFTNVYEDHLGAARRLKSRRDIAQAKSFIFSKIVDGGYAVFNADEPLIAAQLSRIPSKKQVNPIACSIIKRPAFQRALYVDNGEIIYSDASRKASLGRLESYSMYLPSFETSGLNILIIIGSIIGLHDGVLPGEELMKRLKHYRPATEEGRLIVLDSAETPTVILDFAHESFSLQAVAGLAHSLSPSGKVIGVLRLSPTRTDEHIKKTAKKLVGSFDRFIIYDKIDGVTRMPNSQRNPVREEKVGQTSKTFFSALAEAGADARRVVQEDKAFKAALSIASNNDVIVHIQGNDPARSLKLIKQALPGIRRIKR